MSTNLQNKEYMKDLILKAKSGDKEAFAEVYNSYYTPLFRYILSRIKNTRDAEDLTQTVFLKVWKNISKWNDKHTSPLSFFFTVAHNTLIDHVRKKTTKEIISDELVYDNEEVGEVLVYEEVDKEIAYANLNIYIKELSEDRQEILNLYYGQDLSYKEISEIMNKKEEAIRKIHSRAIQKLREIYKEEI